MKEKLTELFSSAREKLLSANNRLNQNTQKYKMTNIFLVLLFPLFIVSMAEINQGKYPSKFILFLVEKPMVMVFNVIIASLIFYCLAIVFKRCSVAILVQSVVYMALSITELFKYGTNGNHLILTDMKLARSLKSLQSFAYIKITVPLVIYVCIVLLYVALAIWFNPKIEIKVSKRIATVAGCIIFGTVFMTNTSVSYPVYALFDIDTTASDNTFKLNEKFENNSFLAFILETASESISNKLEVPEKYSEEAIDEFLDVEVNTNEDIGIKPNVIMIMSEAFADFRNIEDLNLQTDAYDKIDLIAQEGYRGTAIVPTFASYTVRTEFELLFGLPVRSLNDPNMPQRVLLDRTQPTIVRYYKDMDYATAYVHPFVSTFYSRKRIYSQFGFDTMIFEDDFTVPVEYLGSYISDKTVFDQLEQLIDDSEKPIYIHTTTMQNHQPYNQGVHEDEFSNYLDNISVTTDALYEFIQHLKEIDEPTVVFFMGDHFPSFKGTDTVYTQLGLNGENCGVVYEQDFIVWSNYELDYSEMPDENFSAFYVPYVIADLIGAEKDSLVQAMLDKMQTLPIYSTNYDTSYGNDDDLDILTYDRILGDNISFEGFEELTIE